jgi:hypothetical protein
VFYDLGQTVRIQEEPLEAVDGQSLSVLCNSPDGRADLLILREDGEIIDDSRIKGGMENSTHREIIINLISRTDNGGIITCSLSDLNSEPAEVTVFCKLTWTRFRGPTNF